MKSKFYIKKIFVWEENDNQKIPNVDFIQQLIRRRLTDVEKIGLYVSKQLEPYEDDAKIVFASQYGEWNETIKLIQQIYYDGEMSPAGFTHSVHNAMPGILSIVKKNPYNYTTIAANDDTIDCALLESFSTHKEVVLIYAEEKIPEFYKEKFGKSFMAHGIGLIISTNCSNGAIEVDVDYTVNGKKSITYNQLLSCLNDRYDLIGKYFCMKVIK